MKRFLESLCLAAVGLLLAACSSGDTLDGGNPSNPTEPGGEGPDTGAVLAGTAVTQRVNGYRQQAGLPPLAHIDYLRTSARRHAAYQALDGAIGHFETNTSNPFYSGYDILARVAYASTGTPNQFPASVNTVYEDVAFIGSTDAVDLWWNSVYHRLPMLRHEVEKIGYGDRAAAAATWPGNGLPSTGPAYGTLNFAGDAARARTLSHWPADGATGIFLAFNTDNESPDPLDGDSGPDDPNSAPAAGIVGTPLHVVYPSPSRFTAMLVRLERIAAGSSPQRLACFVLVRDGGLSLVSDAFTGYYNDTMLTVGEIFILPAAPLRAASTYSVSVQAADLLGELPPLTWSFTTGSF